MSISLDWLQRKFYPHRYQFLLAALACVFVVNIIFPEHIYGGVAQAIYLPVLILATFVVFESKKRVFYLLALIALALIGCRILNIFLANNINNGMTFLYVCYFAGVFGEVLRQIYRTCMVSSDIVMAAVCGLLLIGYCGFYIFLAIEFYQPGSFNNLSSGIEAVNDLFYFSFVTILTVGYGHITPATWIAKNATVLVALCAYIYSWVVIATIVGEVTSRKSHNREADKDSDK